MTRPVTPGRPRLGLTVLRCAGALAAVVGGYLAVGILVVALVPDRVVATVLADLAALGVVIVVRRRRPGWLGLQAPRPRLAWARRDTALAVAGLVTAFGAGQAASLLAYAASGSTGFDQVVEATDAVPAVAVVALSLLVAPLGEEALLRGALYPALRRSVPPAVATAVTCVVFSILHGNLVQGIVVVPLGVLLAVVYERTQRLVAVMVLHVAFNTAALVVPVAVMAALASPVCVAVLTGAFVAVVAALWRPAPAVLSEERSQAADAAD